MPTADASLRFIRDCATLETLDLKLVGPQLLLGSDFARGSRDGGLRTLALQWGGEPPADLQGIALLSSLHDMQQQGGPSVPPPVSVLRALSQLKQLRMLELTNAVYDLESRLRRPRSCRSCARSTCTTGWQMMRARSRRPKATRRGLRRSCSRRCRAAIPCCRATAASRNSARWRLRCAVFAYWT